MIDVGFISDLHLHPEEIQIQKRFDAFIHWAKKSLKQLYILGDFFHAWVGDDALDGWSKGIASQIAGLNEHGVSVYYLHGNRDFLLGKRFAELAKWKLLSEPTLIELGNEPVLLMHGDSFCTLDLAHQRFRLLTRNALFPRLFLKLPLNYRKSIVQKMREHSRNKQNKPLNRVDVVSESVLASMRRSQTQVLIHGHTHRPGLTLYEEKEQVFRRYVLSDWDDSPQILCYDASKGLYFNQL